MCQFHYYDKINSILLKYSSRNTNSGPCLVFVIVPRAIFEFPSLVIFTMDQIIKLVVKFLTLGIVAIGANL